MKKSKPKIKKKQLPTVSKKPIKPNLVLDKNGFPMLTCKTCSMEMAVIEYSLRRGECVACKTKRELGL